MSFWETGLEFAKMPKTQVVTVEQQCKAVHDLQTNTSTKHI